jgi:hypothetical protein
VTLLPVPPEEPIVHDHPASLDQYEHPICVTPGCGRQLWVSENDRWACRPCEDATGRRLAELPALFARLDTTAALMRGAARPGGGSSGSKTPPIPPRLEVLALVGPGGAATRLSAIEDAWRQTLGWTIAPWRGSPTQAVPAHVAFLVNNVRWACERYEPVGQDVSELRTLHNEMTALASGEKRPGRVPTGLCPAPVDAGTCGTQLTATADSHRIRCKTCGARWETLGEWRELRAAQEQVLAEAAGAAA